MLPPFTPTFMLDIFDEVLFHTLLEVAKNIADPFHPVCCPEMNLGVLELPVIFKVNEEPASVADEVQVGLSDD